jgi:hypothetical protein
LSRFTVRSGSASASAMACSFQPLFSRVSMAAPDIDAVHRGANEVLRQRPHQVARLVGVADEHIDCCEVSPDRLLYSAIAGIDHERAVFFDDNGRLDDSDRLDRREQLLIHRW